MKITAVMGSPNKNGSSSVLAKEVLKGAEANGAEIEEIFLADYRIDFCLGCLSRNTKKFCMSTGICNIKDDTAALQEKLYKSDGIILASPAYGLKPTARMKNFLSDRIGMYTAYTSSLGGKYFVSISSCGGIGARKVAKDLPEDFLAGFHMRSYCSGHLAVHAGYGNINDRADIMKKAYKLGVKLTSDINRKRKYPFQMLFKRIMFRLYVRKLILNNIYKNKDSKLKSVYDNLVERNLITAK